MGTAFAKTLAALAISCSMLFMLNACAAKDGTSQMPPSSSTGSSEASAQQSTLSESSSDEAQVKSSDMPNTEIGEYVPGTVDTKNKVYTNESFGLSYELPKSCKVSEGAQGTEECYAFSDDRHISWSFTYVMSDADDEMLDAYVRNTLEELSARGDGLDYERTEIKLRGVMYPAITVYDDASDPPLMTIQTYVLENGHIGVIAATGPSFDIAYSLITDFAHRI